MTKTELAVLQAAIRQHWWHDPRHKKAEQYADQFFDTQYIGNKVWGQVVGNHGTYMVSIQLAGRSFKTACSCYIGKDGYCHHVDALAIAVLDTPQQFKPFQPKSREEIHDLDDLREYLNSVTLADILKELKTRGITQKAIDQALGTSARKLGSLKSSEARNRQFSELGMAKLACLWILDNLE